MDPTAVGIAEEFGTDNTHNQWKQQKLNKMKTSNEQAETKPCTIHGVMWRFSSVILIPIVFFILLVIRPIKWIFTGYYYPQNPKKVKKTLLYKWILKTGLGWFR